MSKNVRNLKSKIKGIRAVILIKDREIVLSEFDDAKAERLSQSMHSITNISFLNRIPYSFSKLFMKRISIPIIAA